MYIYPAIDIMDGKAVRLTKGDYSTAEILDNDPYAVAESFKAKGAERLHIVDLDGAKSGELSNFETIAAITKDLGLFVEVGGGIRDEERIDMYLRAGASRVILGTIAVQNFPFVEDMVKKYGDKIAVGIDCKKGFVAVQGWQEVSSATGLGFAARCKDAGVATIIFTDIDTDGAMHGTNLKAIKELLELKPINIIASGGVSHLSEIRALADMDIEGVILGKALYYDLIDLDDAVRVTKENR